MDCGDADTPQAVTTSGAPHGAGNGTRGTRRLARHETIPHPPLSSSASAALAPQKGDPGMLRGLVARPDLNDTFVRFSHVDAASGRFVVVPESGGDAIRFNAVTFVVNKKDIFVNPEATVPTAR